MTLTQKMTCEKCLQEHCKQLNWSKESHKWICVSCDRNEYKIQRKEPIDLREVRKVSNIGERPSMGAK